MSERVATTEIRHIDYEARLGHRALHMTIIEPVTAERQGMVIPFLPGLASKRRVYEPTARELARRGYQTVLIGHEGATDEGVRAVQYALQALSQAQFAGHELPIASSDRIVPIGHSLGGRKLVESLRAMHQVHEYRIQSGIFEAAACIGGVNKVRAPLDAVRSFRQELGIVRVPGAIEHHKVAIEALEYVRSLGRKLHHELVVAAWGDILAHIQELQADGVRFSGIHHADDMLVSSERNEVAFRQLGVPSVTIATKPGDLAGHNAQLYRPVETADAVEIAVGLLAPTPHHVV